MCDFCTHGPRTIHANSANAITITDPLCTCWIAWGGYKPTCPVHADKEK